MALLIGCGAVACATLLSWSSPADAFSASQHRSITSDSCKAAGLPSDFCKRVAVESYNTDANEWDDLLAHAQMRSDEPPCESANDLMARMSALGGELDARLQDLAAATSSYDAEELAGKAALALGRAIHTVQDNRAHHGVPNPEHAWYSLQDFCEGTSTAPDLRPGAAEAARVDTDEMMARVAQLVASAGVAQSLSSSSCPFVDTSDPSTRDPCTSMYAPAPWDLCSFLAEGKGWDGTDQQWDPDVIGQGMYDSFWGAPPGDVCEEPNLLEAPQPPVDTSGGIPTCAAAHFACFGKVDDPSLAADPAPEAQPQSESSGCSLSSSRSSEPWGLALLCGAMAAIAARRRR